MANSKAGTALSFEFDHRRFRANLVDRQRDPHTYGGSFPNTTCTDTLTRTGNTSQSTGIATLQALSTPSLTWSGLATPADLSLTSRRELHGANAGRSPLQQDIHQ
jgi:hypothetical protein